MNNNQETKLPTNKGMKTIPEIMAATETSQGIILQDEKYLARRYEEFKRAMEVWAKQLNQIVSIAPLQGFEVNLLTGENKQMPLPAEWQDKIDRFLKAKNDWVKSNFPEFYPF